MNAMVTVPGEFGSFGHDYRADTARFVRDAYHLPAVTADQMGRIEAELRTLELHRADRIKASHLDTPPASAQRKNGERELGGVPCASAGPAAPGGCGACHASRARHQATSSRGGRGQSRPDGTDLAVIASRLGVAGTLGNRPRHGRAGTRAGQPDLHPQRDAGVSADDEQRSQPLPDPSPATFDPVLLGSTWLVDPGPSTALGPSPGWW